MYDLKYRIRVICMEDLNISPTVTDISVSFYGIIGFEYDIETVYIDSI